MRAADVEGRLVQRDCEMCAVANVALNTSQGHGRMLCKRSSEIMMQARHAYLSYAWS